MRCSSRFRRPRFVEAPWPGCRGRWTVQLVTIVQACLWGGVLSFSFWPTGAAVAESLPLSKDRPVEILTHDLSVELLPARHELKATDRMTLKALTATPKLSFLLNPALRVTDVQERSEAGSRPLPFVTDPVGKKENAGQEGEGEQLVTIELNSAVTPGQILTLEWNYEGTINEPPRESRHLRFVTPSETSGHIGNEGVYLSGETHWYPEIPGSLRTFRLKATTPEGWEIVTHGKQVGRTTGAQVVATEWEVAAKTEALTLVANRFVVKRRIWQDQSGRSVELATYLFPEDAPLADEYLEASARYLEAYTKLLGPYPFPKFAVAENFFASGLGMPSFTLLGSGVIKRHYVQPYALGHEIVHSWFGNWLFNDVTQENWVEGLTTYLANYYYDELSGKAEQAREQRRMMLLGYAVYVRPDEDYPVGHFRQKVNQKDNAIGYQKAAMVFHMLRREIGEEAFWRSLRKLVAERGGAYSTWQDLERIFSDAAGRSLRWFFTQWVERPGAPSLKLAEVLLQGKGQEANGFTLRLRIVQAGGPYRLGLPLSVTLADGQIHRALLPMESPEQIFTLHVPSKPLSVALDPDYDSFRRLSREQIPPMLNLFVTDRRRSLILPDMGTEGEREPYRELARQILSREQDIIQASGRELTSSSGSALVLGGPGVNRAAEKVAQACGDRVSLGQDRFAVAGQTYEGPGKALLVTCRQSDGSGTVVTLFYGLTPSAAAKVARLLFFYGWQSYMVFNDGAVVTRGDFAAPGDEMEVRIAER